MSSPPALDHHPRAAPTLYDLSKTRLVQNIHMLTDIGDLPYTFLAPILRHIQNPNQLLELETNCPQIVGETGELWLKFIKRDIPEWDKKPHQPRDEKNWAKVYRRLKRDADAEVMRQEEQLREQMRALQNNKSQNQTMIVEARTGYDPTARRKGFGSRGSGSSGWGSSSSNPPPPKTTGKVAFDKLKRAMYDQKLARPKAAQMPTHLLEQRRGVVKAAPERMVRMQEAEAPKTMLVPRRASQAGFSSESSTSRPNITARPSLQGSSSSPKPQRPTLGADQHFRAGRLGTPSGGAPVVKRKREAPSPFMAPKKRKPQ
ncbi:RNA polymerase II transcription factor SIII subunit A-domain-containing protein [Lophiotrema nucula]|uniref:RNA polymerase II transcription factor SIII subunit A-domain-containing protein n=1 Tax=Lophiotrema nucula TaxID=690887 RepID=A0A6A5Z8J6_9PLEO|nr:RNA polymerase II transcription factor SIII subunit A-domain-containing protein [Lophiotrema nucula]